MITKATLCNRPNEIITNILQRVQMESKSYEMTVCDKDESEVKKLHQTIGPRCNTIYSNSFITRHALHTMLTLKESVIIYCQKAHGGNKAHMEWNFWMDRLKIMSVKKGQSICTLKQHQCETLRSICSKSGNIALYLG